MYNRIDGMSIAVRIEKNDFCPFGFILCIAAESNFPVRYYAAGADTFGKCGDV